MSKSTILTGAGRSRWVQLLAILLPAAAIYAAVWVAYSPFSANVHDFSSDDAIPVLMANDRVLDVFRLYFYGMDRFGAWPFLPLMAWHWLTGYVWTAFGVYSWQVAFYLSGTIPFALLVPQRRGAAALVYLTIASLHRMAASSAFELCMVFGWQTASIFWAWLFLRRLSDAQLSQSPDAGGRVRGVGYAALATLFAFIATWSSFVSAPLLCWIVVVEGIRIVDKAGARRERQWAAFAAMTGTVLLAAAVERWMNHVYRLRFKVVTPLDFDWGNLAKNVQRQAQTFFEAGPWSYVCLVGLVAAAILLCARFARIFRSRTASKTRSYLDPLALVLGLGGVAACNLGIATVSAWVRLNEYNFRYLVPTYIFGSLAGLTATVLVPLCRRPRWRMPDRLRLAYPALAVVALLLGLPPFAGNTVSLRLTQAAQAIATQAPHVPIIGTYWGTYTFAGLAPGADLTPVPLPDERNRTPWTTKALAEAGPMLWSSYMSLESAKPVLVVSGQIFRLQEAAWQARHGDDMFSLYQNETHASVLDQSGESLAGWDFCAGGAWRTNRFSPQDEAALALGIMSKSATPLEIEAAAVTVDANGSEIVEARQPLDGGRYTRYGQFHAPPGRAIVAFEVSAPKSQAAAAGRAGEECHPSGLFAMAGAL